MTNIPWAQESWNPITGCTPISDGCKNCYAKRMSQRLKGRFGYPEDDPFKPGNWRGDYTSLSKGFSVIEEPAHWKNPRRIFVCSMSDLFHDNVEVWMIDQITRVIYKNPKHTFLILTKRVDRMAAYFDVYCDVFQRTMKNLWIGITAENQEQLNKRLPVLLQIPAAVHFVSVEPMLSPVDLSQTVTYWDDPSAGIKWVIAGCESGPKRRESKVEWYQDLKNQCVDVGIPFFLKQMVWQYLDNGSIRDGIEKMPILDGKIWDQYPKVEP